MQSLVYLKVKTSQEVCVEAKKPSMGFAETCGAAFEYGPKKLRPWANFARYKLMIRFFSRIASSLSAERRSLLDLLGHETFQLYLHL